ncbi:MAG: dienelactone hydrolase family protein, partial [Flavobacteriales bacterium]
NDLDLLPIDMGGTHKAMLLGNTDAKYNHYIYTPSGYNNNSTSYPLLVFLHGSGEIGNADTNTEALNKVITHGPPKLIELKQWSPKYPMIVASPQLTFGIWKPEDIHSFISYLIKNYNINTKRIYITGVSLGGYGCFTYVSQYASDSYAAAIVPIAGGGYPNTGDRFKTTPVWAFHGDNDNAVPLRESIDIINDINRENPENRAKLTIYPDVGHDSWTRTYDSSGMGDESKNYDPFDMSIYDWMFLFEK